MLKSKPSSEQATQQSGSSSKQGAAAKDSGGTAAPKVEQRLFLLQGLNTKLGGQGQSGSLVFNLTSQNQKYQLVAQTAGVDIHVNRPNLTALKDHYEQQIPYMRRDMQGGKGSPAALLQTALDAFDVAVAAVGKFVGETTVDTQPVSTPFGALATEVGRFLSGLEERVPGGLNGWANSDETPIQPPDLGARRGGMMMVANFGMKLAEHSLRGLEANARQGPEAQLEKGRAQGMLGKG